MVASIREHHENRLFLPGFALPAGIGATTELEEALDGADIVVVAVPAQHVRAVMARAGAWIAPGAIVVSVAKGIEACIGQADDRGARRGAPRRPIRTRSACSPDRTSPAR